MTNPRSPALLLKRVLSATYGCGIDNLFIPQGFFPSKIYKEILAHLDPVNIPTTPPFGHAEWLKIINALEHIAAVVQLFVAAEHPATPDYIEPRIIADTFPSIWKWLVFLHPNSGYFDDDEFYAAAARYGWSRYAVATTGYPCVRAVLWTFFTLLPRSPRRIAAALEIPELPMHLFDLWWSYTSRLPLDQPSDRCTAGLLQALTHFFCDNEPLYTRFADELFSYKGEATMRAIVRRLRYVVRMPEPLFLEMGSILELFLILARFPKFRPVLRPTISLIVPLMDLVNHPGAAQFEAEFMPLMPDENCTLKMHVSNSCLLLDRLSTELRGPRDIARIIRSGFLRALYQHLRTYRVPQMEKCVVAQACSRIVGPGLLFPCVARAVEQAIARENLPRKVKGGLPGFDAWNDMCRILSERAQYEQDFRLQTMALRYCHNPTCSQTSTRVKRCECGGAYYCSRACQWDDWSRHRNQCHLITDVMESNFYVQRSSELDYIRFCVYRDAAHAIRSQTQNETLVVDYTSTIPMIKSCSCEQCLEYKSLGTICARVGTTAGMTVLQFS